MESTRISLLKINIAYILDLLNGKRNFFNQFFFLNMANQTIPFFKKILNCCYPRLLDQPHRHTRESVEGILECQQILVYSINPNYRPTVGNSRISTDIGLLHKS